MSISDKTRKALEKIGLTSYEIRTFSALLKSGELTASELSQKSGVPYSKIYGIEHAIIRWLKNPREPQVVIAIWSIQIFLCLAGILFFVFKN